MDLFKSFIDFINGKSSYKPKKRKSPKEIYESQKNLDERFYVKFPGENMVDVTGISKSDAVIIDKFKVEEILLSHPNQRYTSIHNHPYEKDSIPAPSQRDIYEFLSNPEMETMAIYLLSPLKDDKDYGKAVGTMILRKTKKSSKITPEEEAIFLNEPHILKKEILKRGVKPVLDRLSKSYGFQYKYVPSENYSVELTEKNDFYFRKKDGLPKRESVNSLEDRVLALVSIVSLLFALLFFSSNFTGFFIVNLSSNISDFVGIGLFLLGIIASFLYFKRKNN